MKKDDIVLFRHTVTDSITIAVCTDTPKKIIKSVEIQYFKTLSADYEIDQTDSEWGFNLNKEDKDPQGVFEIQVIGTKQTHPEYFL